MLDPSIAFAAFQLALLGSIAGFLAGLLGIGGGAVLVPGMYYILTGFGYGEVAMHTAVGTSLLTIVFTGTSSARSHHQHGAVQFNVVKQFVPGIIIGVSIGTLLATQLTTNSLKLTFALLQFSFGLYMLLRSKNIALFNQLPQEPWFSLVATVNAAIAALMGVGGGMQNVLYMTICKVPLQKAIGTAAALGPIIAILGTIGFVYIGAHVEARPSFSTGFIHWPSFFCIIATSIVMAPIGAKLAHRLPKQKLKNIFTVFLLIVSIKMGLEVLY